MSTARRVVAAWTIAVGLVVGVVTSPTPSAAQDQPVGSLALVEQTPFVPAEGAFRAVLAWSGELPAEATIGGLLHSPIADESEITEPPANPFSAIPFVDISTVERTAEGHLVFELPIRSVEGGPDRVRLRESGVYPLQIELRTPEGSTFAALRTNLIRLPTEAAETDVLPVSTVIEISSAEGLTVQPATELLTAHPTLPLTVVLGDGVLTQIENDPDLATALSVALDGRAVVAAPSPELDISALTTIGRVDLYADARSATFDRLSTLGLTPAEDITIVNDNLTVAGIDALVRLGIRVLIDNERTARSTGVLEGTEGALRVVEVDATLTAAMRGTQRSVERVHRLLAALSLRSATDRSPVFLGGSALRSVPVESLQLFLSALEQPGTLGTVDLVDAADLAPLFPIRPDEQPTQNLLAVEDLIRTAAANINTYRGIYVNGRLPPSVFERRLVDALATGRNPADRARALQQLNSSIEERFSDIVLPEGQSVTLAAQRASIPLTVENTSDGDRSVLLLFDSDKIDVEQHLTTVVLPPGVSTVDIELEARSLGFSPLQVRIVTPDRTEELAATSFGVRSTAVPGLGLLLSATALLFLLVWWFRSIATARAHRKHPANHEPVVAADAQVGT